MSSFAFASVAGEVDSILKYSGIGFDMDHSFIRYKLKSFSVLMHEAYAIYLISKLNYPQEIFFLTSNEKKEKSRIMFRSVFDHRTGNLLKMGRDNLITRGYFGFTRLF